jgi:hypothetical protein
MAAWTTQLALLVDQLVPALRTPAPMLAGNAFVGRSGTGFLARAAGLGMFTHFETLFQNQN